MTGAAKLVLAFHHAGEEDVDVERGGKGDPFLIGNTAHTCVSIADATSNVHTNLWHDD
jgi:tRNA U54 and U55 pseudouridine synthase Pus10